MWTDIILAVIDLKYSCERCKHDYPRYHRSVTVRDPFKRIHLLWGRACLTKCTLIPTKKFLLSTIRSVNAFHLQNPMSVVWTIAGVPSRMLLCKTLKRLTLSARDDSGTSGGVVSLWHFWWSSRTISTFTLHEVTRQRVSKQCNREQREKNVNDRRLWRRGENRTGKLTER